MKLDKQHYLVYFIVLNWLELKIIVICLKLRAQLHVLAFLSFFGTYSLKVVQTWFLWHETWHTTLINIYYCFEKVRIQKIVICLKLRAKSHF